jgi:predicted dehydrogenase
MLTRESDLGNLKIGVVGAGFIVSDCHLPSYRKAGFNVTAVASKIPNKARDLAARFAIPIVYDDVSTLLADASLDVLDIAVPPDVQFSVIEAACRRGTLKGILAQKPLGVNYAEARRAVQLCEEAGIRLAVNQNMRYDPSVAAAKALLAEKQLGEPVFATIEMRAIPHWMPWQARLGWVTLRIMSIHHLDTFRWWFDDPERIYCSIRNDPRTPFPHADGICTYILEFNSGLRCVGIDDTWTGPAREGCPGDIFIRWRIEGTDGLAIGDIGWCKEPYTSPSSMRYGLKGDPSMRDAKLKGSWFPDAFGETMAGLLRAVHEGKEPEISGRDNLRTMALVEAAYRSAEEHRAVSPDEIS